MAYKLWTFFLGEFLESTNVGILNGSMSFPRKCCMTINTPKNKNERALQTGMPELLPTDGRKHSERSAAVLPLIKMKNIFQERFNFMNVPYRLFPPRLWPTYEWEHLGQSVAVLPLGKTIRHFGKKSKSFFFTRFFAAP